MQTRVDFILMRLTSHKRYGVPNHQELNCLINSLFRQQQRKYGNSSYGGSPLVTEGFPLQWDSNTEIIVRRQHGTPVHRSSASFTQIELPAWSRSTHCYHCWVSFTSPYLDRHVDTDVKAYDYVYFFHRRPVYLKELLTISYSVVIQEWQMISSYFHLPWCPTNVTPQRKEWWVSFMGGVRSWWRHQMETISA